MYRDERYEEAKYRVKISHFTEQGIDISGVMHVGTNDGYELQWYRKMGIEYFVGFEPLPLAITNFQKNYPTLATGKEYFFPFALGSKEDVLSLNQTKGDGQGSSFLFEAGNPQVDPYEIVDKHQIMVKRFDQLMVHTCFMLPMDSIDCLVCDVQGFELEVLKGLGPYLDGFKYLNIECSAEAVYKDGPIAKDIISFLADHNFLQDSPIEPHNDIFFIRKTTQ